MSNARARKSLGVVTFLKKVGAKDLPGWLSLPPDASAADVLDALERRRLELERALHDPKAAHEAELLLEHYDELRAAWAPAHDRGRTAVAPDYYLALGVSPAASFADVERAWRAAQADGRGEDPVVAQAWRVLGDPVNRAAYDRTRREHVTATSGHGTDFTTEPPTAPGDPGCRAELPGPDLREVHVGLDGPTTVPVPLVIRGAGRWYADIAVDHPCLTTHPATRVEVGPGRHTLAIRVDPAMVGEAGAACSVTLTNADEQHVIALRVRRTAPARPLVSELGIALVLGVALLLVGWWLGARTSVGPVGRGPDSEGRVAQIPSVDACLNAAAARPAWVDVHTDGLGRPTGFAFGGPASPDVDRCVRDALMRLDFPPTRDGLPALHRYHVNDGPPPSSAAPPPPSPAGVLPPAGPAPTTP